MKTRLAAKWASILGALVIAVAPAMGQEPARAGAACGEPGILDHRPMWPFPPVAGRAGGLPARADLPLARPAPRSPLTVDGRDLAIGGGREVALAPSIGTTISFGGPLTIRLETRYRRFDALADLLGAPSDDVETTVHVRWTF